MKPSSEEVAFTTTTVLVCKDTVLPQWPLPKLKISFGLVLATFFALIFPNHYTIPFCVQSSSNHTGIIACPNMTAQEILESIASEY